jgi:hypothetical protein
MSANDPKQTSDARVVDLTSFQYDNWDFSLGGTAMILRPTLFAFALFAMTAGTAAGAPPQLYNKTVTLAWTVAQSLKAPDGRIVNPSTSESRTIYISNAGRVFARSSRNTGGASRSSDRAPGDPNRDDRTSQTSGWQFRGNTMVAQASLSGSGGSQFVITFDAAFKNCTLTVTYGKATGAPIRFKGIDGVVYEAIEIRAVGPSCSISEGNPFGSN